MKLIIENRQIRAYKKIFFDLIDDIANTRPFNLLFLIPKNQTPARLQYMSVIYSKLAY